MATLTITHTSLNLTEKLITKVAKISSDGKSIELESHPGVSVSLNERKADEFGLKVGDPITIDPKTDVYTLTLPDAPAKKAAPARAPARSSGAAPRSRYGEDELRIMEMKVPIAEVRRLSILAG